MNIIALAFLAVCVASCLYHLLAALCGAMFLLHRKTDLRVSSWPKASCLKPLCGYDFETELNIKSFLNQDYPEYEIIFGTADKEDRAYSLALSVCEEKTRVPVRVVHGEIGTGANRKVRNLRNIELHVSSDTEILILSDSDTRVTADYIKQMVAPLRDDSQVGAVTSLYRMKNVSGMGGILEALAVESAFAPGVLVAATFSSLRFAFGASIALRRSDFAAAGGFTAVENYLADDYQIGNRIYRHGKRVALSPYVVTIMLPKQNLRSTIAHLIRWNRTIRVSEPLGYSLSIIGNCMLWATLAFSASGANLTGWMVLGGSSAVRIVAAAVVAASLGSQGGIARALLSPMWDLLGAVLWVLGLGGTVVNWRGVRYQLLSDGRITEIHHD